MPDIVFPEKLSRFAGLGWRLVVDDRRRAETAPLNPDAAACVADTGLSGALGVTVVDESVILGTTPGNKRNSKEGEMVAVVNLNRFQKQQGRKRIDEISALVKSLTYGEMLQMAEGIWSAQPEGVAVTQDNLAALLHRWSQLHQRAHATNDAPQSANGPPQSAEVRPA
jgi:hypothetical protein